MGKKSMVRVAYVKEDIDAQSFILKEHAVFLANNTGTKLRGFHRGGTDEIEKLQIYYDWFYEGKLSFYEVPEDCYICKYCHFNEDDYECTACGCVRGPR